MKKFLVAIFACLVFCACAVNTAKYNELFDADMEPINTDEQKAKIIKTLQE